MSDRKPLFAEAMHELLDNMAQLLDTVDGYRQQCLTRGYSETAAEMMAMEFHRQLVANVFRAGGKK